MEAALEVEDDVFFADLSRQISLLIMDDDEVSLDPQYPSVANLQRFANTFPPPLQASSYLSYDFQQQTCKRDQSKGTGVFIPRSSHQRRSSNRRGKPTATANKFLRPYYDHHSARGLIVPQVNYNINSYSSLDQTLNNVRRRF